MEKRRKKILFIILLIVAASIIIGSVWNIIDLISDREIRHEGEHWLTQAKKDASASMTLEDARHWLTKNGFEVLVWNPNNDKGWIGNERSSKNEDAYLIVQGSLLLAKKSPFVRQTWVDLTFKFNENKKFQDVYMKIRSYSLPK